MDVTNLACFGSDAAIGYINCHIDWRAWVTVNADTIIY
jgi:hypothetical protein